MPFMNADDSKGNWPRGSFVGPSIPFQKIYKHPHPDSVGTQTGYQFYPLNKLLETDLQWLCFYFLL